MMRYLHPHVLPMKHIGFLIRSNHPTDFTSNIFYFAFVVLESASGWEAEIADMAIMAELRDNPVPGLQFSSLELLFASLERADEVDSRLVSCT